jgi:tRNA(Ile)-lysidine synthase TilS/MesJ
MGEGIPHLVKMHEKYGKDGLVVLTVTLDEDTSEDVTPEQRAKWRKTVENYVARSKLPFRTYDLAFDPRKRPEPLAFSDGVPRVFVFNRDNQFVLREQGPEEKQIEKAIAEAVKKK